MKTTMSNIDHTKVLTEIETLAKEAGGRILSADASHIKQLSSEKDSASGVTVTTKSSRRDLVTSKDLEIQQFLMTELRNVVPTCKFLCEEDVGGTEDVLLDPDEIKNGICFIIDPIDGTANFVHGNKHSCTSIAMTVDGETKIGVIYDPYRDELFSAIKNHGCYLNHELLPVFDSPAADGIAVFGTAPYADDNHEPTFRLAKILYEMTADVRRTGSAALDCCWTACGRFVMFAEMSVSAWDFAAGRLIAEETGCIVTDLSGEPLSFKGKPTILCGRPTAVSEFHKVLKEKF